MPEFAMIKRFNFLFLLVFFSFAYSQNSAFEQYAGGQKQAREIFSAKAAADFKRYNDSLNEEYGKYLEKEWQKFDLQIKKMSFKPMPKPPAAEPNAQKLEPSKIPLLDEPTPPDHPQPKPVPAPPFIPKPEPEIPQNKTKTNFFGTSIILHKVSGKTVKLKSASEKDVAAYWSFFFLV